MAIYRLSVKHQTKGKGVTARAHAMYVAREGKYAERHVEYLGRKGDHKKRAHELEYIGHGNMPDWSKENPMGFWEAADIYERANGRVYTEILVTLPRELKRGERLELIREFVGEELGEKHVYTVAIHNPKAMDGGEQPHAHIMFSNRELDGIEREKELFFRRANDTNPELGGAKKSRAWSMDSAGHDKVSLLRESWERHANRALERAGHEVTIDRRSLQERGIEREPEPKMGPEVTQRLKRGQETEVGARVIELRDYRKSEREIENLERELKREKERVFDLRKERELRNREDENGLFFTGKKRVVPEEERQRYQRTLDLVLTKIEREDGKNEYRWKKSGKVAFTDHGDKIVFDSITPAAIKAGLQLSREKGWEGVRVEGGHEFRRENWLQGQVMGIEIVGYEARDLDFKELRRRREEEELKKKGYLERDRAVEEPHAWDRRDGLYMKASEVLIAFQVSEKEIRQEIALIEKERRDLGLHKVTDWTEKYPEALTQKQAREKAELEYNGGELGKLHSRAMALEAEFLKAEKALTDFEREQTGRGIKRYLPKYIKIRSELSREYEARRLTFNRSAEENNRVLESYDRPEHQETIEKRAVEFLKADELLQERRKDADKRLSKKHRELEFAISDQYTLRRLQDREIRIQRTKNGIQIVDALELRREVERLARQRSRGRGHGFDR